jgi:predicted metal-dependent phosphoesterase TrpH
MKALKICSFLFVLSVLSGFLKGQEFEVKVLNSASDLPENFCTLGKKGDYFITDGKYLILIGGTERTLQTIINYPAADAKGSIIGFAPAGKNLVSDMIVGSPYLRIKDKRTYLRYNSVKFVKQKSAQGELVIQAFASFEEEKDMKAEIVTEYRLQPNSNTIGLTSKIKNTGKISIEDLQYSLYFRARHQYSFSPFHSAKHPDLNFRVYPKKGFLLGWLNQNPLPRDKELLPGTLKPGESFEVHFMLLVTTESDELLQDIYKILDVKTERAKIYFEKQVGDLAEVIVQDPISQTVFYRSFHKKPTALEVLLPKGIYSVTANSFPAVVEKLFLVEPDKENICVLQEPAHGTVKVKIQNSNGDYIPGKVTFIGLDPTKTPYFEPDNPMETGRLWETFKNSKYPEEGGLEVGLPVGAYLIYASRGPEYTMDSKILEIFQDLKEELTFHIDKVIQLERLISVDPHMHTVNSDGRMDIAERIKSVVAEGVDVAVSTDHNYLSDYQPALIKLGLDEYLATVVGNEVTTGGVIHYNTYPLLLREDEENNGAIDPHREEASFLFHASREKDPKALLQVNHPRSGSIGYFNNYELDPEDASSARKNFDLSFDVLEVMNGPYPYDSNEQSITDWLNLLNRGYYFPIVGSSDAHTIDRGEPGYSRTYVFYQGGRGKDLDVSTLIQAIKKGHAFASNGPVVDFTINEENIPGDSLTAKDGKVDIRLEVKSAPWISVDEVRLIVNGNRKIIFPVRESKDSVLKFSETISLSLMEDSSIAAEILGKSSLFPVHQSRARYGLCENATLPYALTNPIFVDVDGNGRFDPPLSQDIQMKEMTKAEKNEDK